MRCARGIFVVVRETRRDHLTEFGTNRRINGREYVRFMCVGFFKVLHIFEQIGIYIEVSETKHLLMYS